MKKYLFLFTITPVQSFISQARKTRDLFSGSKLLSELINESIKLLPPNNTLIFPNENVENKPNRFVVEIEAGDDDEIKKLGETLSEKVKERLVQIGNEKFNRLFAENLQKPKNFNEQLQDFLFPYWAAVELSDKPYELVYKELEATLGATKNIRRFNQINEEPARKCSVCGERNALFYGPPKKDKNGKEKKPPYHQQDALFNVGDLLENEGLCAICFTKRFYYETKSEKEFPSTAAIATMNVVEQIQNDSTYLEYQNILGRDFDAQLFYEENLTPKYFRKNGIQANLEQTRKAYYKLRKSLKNKSLGFPKYYALIMFDGDSMGKWLSGANLKEDVKLKEFHKQLTSTIGEFAQKASEILKKPRGKVIFAGGEDFMGFVNLEHLFDVVVELRKAYDTEINQKLAQYVKENNQFSFSAGIIITHYKLPLSETINWARKLEKESKNLYDEKNAFSLAVLKHSGEIHQTTYQWGTQDNLTINFETIGLLVKKLLDEVFSNTFITNFRKEMQLLTKDKDKINRKILETELKRLIQKSFMLKRGNEEQSEFDKHKEKEIKELQFYLMELLNNTTNTNLENFFYALEIADFVHRKIGGAE